MSSRIENKYHIEQVIRYWTEIRQDYEIVLRTFKSAIGSENWQFTEDYEKLSKKEQDSKICSLDYL